MKKTILSIVFALATLTYNDAQANFCNDLRVDDLCCMSENLVHNNTFYVGGVAGVNFMNNKSSWGKTFNTGFAISGSIGYRFLKWMRVEAEYTYRRNKLTHYYHSNSRLQNDSVMGNLFSNLPIVIQCGESMMILPYVGAGLGCEFQHLVIKEHNYYGSGHSYRSYNKNFFAWQLMAGVVYPVNCNFDVSLDYKYYQTKCRYNNTVGLGLKYYFTR